MNQGIHISSPNMPLTVQYVDTYQMMCLIASTPHSGTSGAKTASMETWVKVQEHKQFHKYKLGTLQFLVMKGKRLIMQIIWNCRQPELSFLLIKQVWYFISINQPGLRRSDPLKSSLGSHSLLVSDSVGTTSSCSLLAFPLSVSLASSRLHCLCFSVSISIS